MVNTKWYLIGHVQFHFRLPEMGHFRYGGQTFSYHLGTNGRTVKGPFQYLNGFQMANMDWNSIGPSQALLVYFKF